MSIKAIRSALDTRLATLASPPPIAYENVQYAPVVGTMFLDVALMPAQTEHPTITGEVGQEMGLEQGIYQVTVNAPVNQGPGAAATRAEAIRALFPRGLSLTSGAVQVRVRGRPSVAPALVDADWYRVPVSVPYFAYVVG